MMCEAVLISSAYRSLPLVKHRNQSLFAPFHRKPSMMLVSCVCKEPFRSATQPIRISLPLETSLILELTKQLVQL